ncbi:MAG: hypothetical protein LBL75_02290 [Rickettsiales bacterium]|jgi:hypothetical protein|nr:hypothetical protein [Rickettsiales bacterium]
MKSIKNHGKFVIGIIALILVAGAFFMILRSHSNLEDASLKSWLTASDSRRATAADILTNGDTKNSELLSQCITKMAQMTDSGNVKVRDAAALCSVGIALRSDEK